MDVELFSRGDTVEFQPSRDRFESNVNGRFNGRLTVEVVRSVERRDAIHPQVLILRDRHGDLIKQLGEPETLLWVSGWLFSKI